MEGKDLNAAATHLAEALTRRRRINLAAIEPDILLAWAGWYRKRGNDEEARARAEEALAIAERCEYRLTQAEIHNFLARLALDEGDREAARLHAERARERAWCDGPPYCYKVALDEAEGVLRELGRWSRNRRGLKSLGLLGGAKGEGLGRVVGSFRCV